MESNHSWVVPYFGDNHPIYDQQTLPTDKSSTFYLYFSDQHRAQHWKDLNVLFEPHMGNHLRLQKSKYLMKMAWCEGFQSFLPSAMLRTKQIVHFISSSDQVRFSNFREAIWCCWVCISQWEALWWCFHLECS